MDKKGQGLSVTTLILVVIGVLILVMLIAGFSLGWSKIFPFLSSPNNVQSVVETCRTKCSFEAQYDFCTQPREINFEGEPVEDIVSGQEYTCDKLSEVEVFGVEKCPAIECASADDDAGDGADEDESEI